MAESSKGEQIYDLDLELTPYQVFKQQGAMRLIEIIEKGNFYELEKSMPERGENERIVDFYEKLKNGEIDYIDESYYLHCEQQLREKLEQLNGEKATNVEKISQTEIDRRKEFEDEQGQRRYIVPSQTIGKATVLKSKVTPAESVQEEQKSKERTASDIRDVEQMKEVDENSSTNAFLEGHDE